MIWLWRKDSNLRMAALTVRCLTNLATPQEIFTEPLAVASGSNTQGPPRLAVSYEHWRRRRESNPYRSVYKTDALLSSGATSPDLVELRGVEPLRPACKA